MWENSSATLNLVGFFQSQSNFVEHLESAFDVIMNQRSQRDDSRIQKERNKANDFMFKLQYDVSIFSNRRQSDFTKCSLMISQREIMISQLV